MMARPSTLLITTAEAARRLGISRERLGQLLEGGALAGIRIEGRCGQRYVDLNGEGGKTTKFLVSLHEAARRPEVSAAAIREGWLDPWGRSA